MGGSPGGSSGGFLGGLFNFVGGLLGSLFGHSGGHIIGTPFIGPIQIPKAASVAGPKPVLVSNAGTYYKSPSQGTDNFGGLQSTAPIDVCRGRSWEQSLIEMNNGLADANMGLKVDRGAHLENPGYHSLRDILSALQVVQWKRFYSNMDPLHIGGIHLEGLTSSHAPAYKDGNWYHMVWYAAKSPVYAPGTRTFMYYKDDWDKPPVYFEMHCERGGLRPSSIKHGVDYVKEILIEPAFRFYILP